MATEILLKSGKEKTSLYLGGSKDSRRWLQDNAIVLKTMGLTHVFRHRIGNRNLFKIDLDLVLKKQVF